MSLPDQSVLIIGAGINGVALARELVLSGVSVVLVEQADLAYGATAYSSRLIHGGLRYLEYGEFDLVRESLAERTRLLHLAPQLVKPLRLYIPVENRFGGLWTSAARFLFKGNGKPTSHAHHESRGLWLVRFGLRLYDLYARDPELEAHATHRAGRDDTIPVASKYRWLCSYSDAQVRFPERLVVAMLTDARQAASASGARLDVFTRHQAALAGRVVSIRPTLNYPQAAQASDSGAAELHTFEPAAIVNATGAWVDETLASVRLPSPRLMGGTKGSHIVSWNARLRELLAGRGLYAEADDGRPVFVLPFGDATLIGTTDERYSGDPAAAVATREEIDYLIQTVNELLPQVAFTEQDVDLHYSGVRPLPYVGETTPAGVTRRHSLVENRDAAVPFYSVVGGKLTTCRSLAQEVAATVLTRIGRPVTATSADRPVAGGRDCPRDPAEFSRLWQVLADQLGYSPAQIRAVWQLCGTQTAGVLGDGQSDRGILTGTDLPLALVRYVIRHEWVGGLDDLVERRLMLLYHHRLPRATLVELAGMLAAAGVIERDHIEAQVEHCSHRLHVHFGKQLVD